MRKLLGRLLCWLDWHQPFPGHAFDGYHMFAWCHRCDRYVHSRRGVRWRDVNRERGVA